MLKPSEEQEKRDASSYAGRDDYIKLWTLWYLEIESRVTTLSYW